MDSNEGELGCLSEFVNMFFGPENFLVSYPYELVRDFIDAVSTMPSSSYITYEKCDVDQNFITFVIINRQCCL